MAQNVVEGNGAEDGGIEETLSGVACDPKMLFRNVESGKRRFDGGDALDQEVFRPSRTSETDDRTDVAVFPEFFFRVGKSPDQNDVVLVKKNVETSGAILGEMVNLQKVN
jgi:hypothetical protein